MKRRLELILLLGCAALAAASWARHFARLADPATIPGGYNSDSAMPVLMANEAELRVESLYYWAQDRFGGLPFAVGSLLHRALGVVWTPSGWTMFQALWVALSIAVLAWWARSAVPALTWACVLVAGSVWPVLLYDPCQPYAWQLTWLLCALAVMHRRVEEDWRGAWGSVLLTVLVLLTQWANSMSGPLLAGIALGELVRGRGKRARLALGVLVPVVVGCALEGVLRAIFQLRYKRDYGISVATQVWLDAHDLPRWVGLAFAHFEVWLLVALLACHVLALAWLLGRKLPGWVAYPAICAVGNMLIPPWVAHLRSNGMEAKYFTLAAFFAVLACAALLADWAMKRERWRAFAVLPAAALLALGPLLAKPPERDAGYAQQLEFARALAAQRPGAFLSSGYWDTYLLASLAPPQTLLPVARAGQYQRTPHLYGALAKSQDVWVGDQGTDDVKRPELIAFQPHVQLGWDLFVPSAGGERFAMHGKELRLYRSVASQLVTRFKVRPVCPDAPLDVELPEKTAELVAVAPAVAVPLHIEGAAEPAREGTATVWKVSAGTVKLETRGAACTPVQLFALTQP